MYQKKKTKLSRKDKKTESVSFRCPLETKRRMETKAEKIGVSPSKYIVDCIETNLRRNTRSNKQKVKVLVEGQEAINRMILSLSPEQQEIKDNLTKITKGEMELWDF